jgi:hypothetical protein
MARVSDGCHRTRRRWVWGQPVLAAAAAHGPVAAAAHEHATAPLHAGRVPVQPGVAIMQCCSHACPRP